MPTHLKQNEYGYYYLVDGYVNKSLKTKSKRHAEALLRKHLEGKLGLDPLPTVKEYYEGWIETKIEPLCRVALQHGYRQHFTKHILPKFGALRSDQVKTGDLVKFQLALLQKVVNEKTKKKMAVKTCRNIIDGSFRALYRDARAEYSKQLMGYDPFLHAPWPKLMPERPDPFTVEERDKIIKHSIENDFFYYPWVFTLFHTGMRPSEASGLTCNDVDLNARELWITKSRYMGTDAPPKTSASSRRIEIALSVV